MKLERLTLLRNDSQEGVKASNLLKSAKVSNLFKRNKIHFVEVNSGSYSLPPSLMKAGATYRGYNRILEYINSLYPTH